MGIFDNLLGNKKDDLSINEEIERLRSRLADLESRASASQATPQSEVPEQPSVTPSPEEPEPEPQPETPETPENPTPQPEVPEVSETPQAPELPETSPEDELKKKEEELKAREEALAKREEEVAAREKALEEAAAAAALAPTTAAAPAIDPAAPAIDPAALKGIDEKIATILSKIEDIEYKDKIIKDLHEDLRENKRDFTAELSKPFLTNLVKIHQSLRGVFFRFKVVESPDTENFPKVIRELENNMLNVQDMLEQEYNLAYEEPEIGSKYNPKEQNALQAVITDDESKNGTIAEVVYGGFRDLDKEKMFKPALVKPYRFEKN